jgi:hypothetical protein
MGVLQFLGALGNGASKVRQGKDFAKISFV